MTELHELTALQQREALASGTIGSEELSRHYLARISERDRDLGAFTTVTADAALRRARAADAERHAGTAEGALHGLPLADKDLNNRAGVVTGSGSRLSASEPAAESDDIVRRVDAAGAISLGKTSAPEYGMTAYTRNARAAALGLPPSRNPYDLSRDPGGSSGGAAIAVSAGLLPFAPGSDGGGSIRIPASATGLLGLKPSRGLIPNGQERPGRLVVPGTLTRTVADAALLLSGLLAPESPAEALPYLAAAAAEPAPGLRIGLLTDSPWRSRYTVTVDPDISTALEYTAQLLQRAGHHVEPLPLTGDDGYPEAFLTLWRSLSAGLPAEGREELLEPFTRWLWRAGLALSPEETEAALQRVQEFERHIVQDFARFDLVLSPTLGLLPVPIDWFDQDDPERNFEQQCLFSPYTSFLNVVGLPAISVPAGLSRATDAHPPLPIGIQLIGRPRGEAALLSLAGQLERLLPPTPRPPGF